MKRILILLLFAVICLTSEAQLPSKTEIGPNLSISFNKNIELLGFAYFLAYEGQNSETKFITIEGEQVLEKEWQRYGYQLYQRYQEFQSSPHLRQAISVTEYLWLSDIIPLLLSIEDFPNASITPSLNPILYLAFSKKRNIADAKKNASFFLSACNDLYKEVDFDAYLKKSSNYYQSALAQLMKHLPETDFIPAMERFYQKKLGQYQLVPSLTIPNGMGFSATKERGSQKTVCNVFGGIAYQHFTDPKQLNMGFGEPNKLRELSVHEFGHAFVNPYIDALPKNRLDSCADLFKPIRARMEEQGYTTWRSCIAEHFVRAGEILIAEQMKPISSSKQLETEYLHDRKFIYLPIILQELRVYGNDKQGGYSEVIERVMQKLVRKQAASGK